MSALFEKTRIKSLELKNRLVRSATHEGMCDRERVSHSGPVQAI